MINQNNKTSQRPFSMEYVEAKNKIVNAINEANRVNGVPCYLLESILSDLLSQVRECAKKELTQAEKDFIEKQKKPITEEVIE